MELREKVMDRKPTDPSEIFRTHMVESKCNFKTSQRGWREMAQW